jgi:hypothetical protein
LTDILNLTPLDFLKPLYNVCSIDLGQANDYTAVSVATKYERITKEVFGDQKTEGYETHVRYQTRFRQIPYPEIIARIKRIISKIPGEPQYPKVQLYILVDVGGCGRPVYDELKKVFREGGGYVYGYQLTGGETGHIERGIFYVPKKDIVGSLIYAAETGLLKLAGKIETRDALALEWEAFSRKRRESGTESFEGKNEHDDLIISLGFLMHFCMKQHGIYFITDKDPGVWHVGMPVPKWLKDRRHLEGTSTESTSAELVRMPAWIDK